MSTLFKFLRFARTGCKLSRAASDAPSAARLEPLEGRVLMTAAPNVAAPHSTVAGSTLGEWSAQWWQWALAQPAGQNPLTDTTGASACVGQDGGVFFLGGAFSTEPVVRTITMPMRTKLFFPLINVFYLNDLPEDPPLDQQRDILADFIDPVSELHATVDGIAVGGDLFSHREVSPQVDATLPDDNVLNHAPGSFPVVSDGYWLMLNPLSKGEHTITFGGSSPYFSQDLTYHVEVVPKGQYRKEPCPAPAEAGAAANRGPTGGRAADDVLESGCGCSL